MKYPSLLVFYAIFLLTHSLLTAKNLPVKVSAGAAILINAETGRILYEKNAKKQVYPASTTKIATALYTLKLMEEHLDFPCVASAGALATITAQAKRDSNWRSPPYFLENDGTHISIKKGEVFTLGNLIIGMLLASANDAANVIANSLGTDIEDFVSRMNLYLIQIGCLSTHFSNPHGLHYPDHLTTAYDLALIAKEGLRIPFFRETVAHVHYTLPETNLQKERLLVQSNKLLKSGANYYSKAIGIKTGYTSLAGGTLVAAAENENRKLIAVVLDYSGESQRYSDVIALFEAAFNEKKMRQTFFSPGDISFTTKIKGAKKTLTGELQKGLFYDFYPSEQNKVTGEVSWFPPLLPIAKGVCVGEVRLVDSWHQVLVTAPLVAHETIAPTFFFSLFYMHRLATFLSLGILISVFLLLVVKRSSRV